MEVDKLLSKLCSTNFNNCAVSNTYKTLELGFNLGGFLCEAGWYPAGTRVHRACVNILRKLNQVGWEILSNSAYVKRNQTLVYCLRQ